MATPRRHVLVQLPFPSTLAPHPAIQAYYRDYARVLAGALPDYFVPEDGLWEMPLWIAHLAGILESIGGDVDLLDLSQVSAEADRCAEAALDATEPGDLVYLSPLAQNFELALAVSRRLRTSGRGTVLGGNMAPLATPADASLIHRGQLSPESVLDLLRHEGDGLVAVPPRTRGRISWTPSYRILEGYRASVPLLRLNASHGCLFRCSFCGDAWSQQLHVVERAALESEVAELESLFPDTRLVYVGDKSFGQSKEAVANLESVFASRRGYKFIVQTHAVLVTSDLIATMRRLGVVAVELGLETGDFDLLRESNKAAKGEAHYVSVIRALNDAGMIVVLNVLGGLPAETAASHRRTVDFLQRTASDVSLYNLYNFVPYPLTPYFAVVKERIFNWDFASWREDAPPVFRPYHLTAEASWHAFLEKVAVAHELVGTRLSGRSHDVDGRG
ncbi:MAG TPA: radical SAM protein [Actinomycetota bacterium]|nr:radical SAM protein [Actinomycetota bacterium]